MKVEIVAGCELDAAVAKAIGLQGELVGLPPWAFVVDAKVHRNYFGLPDTRLSNSTYRNKIVGDSWNPSTDANAAFEAAENAGLFELGYVLGQCDGGRWHVLGLHEKFDRGFETPSLAICSAVLKLVEENRAKFSV